MQTVRHNIYGNGEVISKEVKGEKTYITVKFESGKEARFAIPESFMLGVMVGDDSLNEEVNAAIAAQRARDEERLERRNAEMNADTAVPAVRHTRRSAAPVAFKGDIESAFEEYLATAGYREFTDSGNPSTVFSYSHAIKKVLEEEGLSWHTLQNNIENIIPIYDIGGAKQHIGAKSKCTIINALKRFGEFVNS